MKGLYKFYSDHGRGGELNGLFIATQEEVDKIIGKYIYFGEVAGKNSEIDGELEEGDIKLLTNNQEVISILKKACGNTVSGINPIVYYKYTVESGRAGTLK